MPIPGTWDDPKKKQTDDPGAVPQSGTSNPAIQITNVFTAGETHFGSTAALDIHWTTSQAASGWVQYGVVGILDNRTAEVAALSTNHGIHLGNLIYPGQYYFVRVHSRLGGGKDGGNNAVLDGYDFYQDFGFVT